MLVPVGTKQYLNSKSGYTTMTLTASTQQRLYQRVHNNDHQRVNNNVIKKPQLHTLQHPMVKF